MQLRILGCSGSVETPGATSAYLVDGNVLVDAGTGAGRLSLEQMGQLTDVFLTHAHFDHMACLPMILDNLFDKHPSSINLTALPSTLEALRAHVFNWVMWPDFTQALGREQPVVTLHAMNPGETQRLATGTLTMLPATHAVPAAGYLLSAQSEVLAFSGDCTSNRDLWAALNAAPRLDHLIVDVAFPNEREALAPQAGHFTPELLASDLSQLAHNPVIWITHTTPGWGDHILEQCRRAIPSRDVRLLQTDQIIDLA